MGDGGEPIIGVWSSYSFYEFLLPTAINQFLEDEDDDDGGGRAHK